MSAPRPNLKVLSILGFAGPNNEALLKSLSVRKTSHLVLSILKLLILLEVIGACSQLVHSLLVSHHETLVALQHILVMEALEVLTALALLRWKQMNLRELVAAEEVLKGRKAALKGGIIYTVIDPQINMLQLLLIRRRIGLLLDQADELLESQRGRIDLTI